MPVTVEDVRAVARDLPRAYEVVVHDRVKFRVGQIVWLGIGLMLSYRLFRRLAPSLVERM